MFKSLKQIEILLEQIKIPSKLKVEFEQYIIPSNIAATIMHIAAYTYNDIINKIVCDLGCGTGRLTIASALFGAKKVIGIDIDPDILNIANMYTSTYNLKNKIDFICGDVQSLCLKCDTVIQNPPFGIQKPHLDVIFLECAMKFAPTVYSLHKHNTKIQRYLQNKVHTCNREISKIATFKFTIPYQFSFHYKKKHTFLVDLYRIT